MKTIRKNKRHFQLLEIMIAIFILTVCLAPTLRIFTNMFISQQQIVHENQKSHLVHMAHAKVVEKLYKREIPMMDISAKKTHHIDDRDIKELLNKAPFQLSYELSIEKGGKVKKEGDDIEEEKEEVDYLCKLDIKVQQLNSKREPCSEETFEYYIYVDTRSDKESEEKRCEEEGLETETEENDEVLRERGQEGEDESDYDGDEEEYEFDDDDEDEYEFDDEDEDDISYKSVASGDRS